MEGRRAYRLYKISRVNTDHLYICTFLFVRDPRESRRNRTAVTNVVLYNRYIILLLEIYQLPMSCRLCCGGQVSCFARPNVCSEQGNRVVIYSEGSCLLIIPVGTSVVHTYMNYIMFRVFRL